MRTVVALEHRFVRTPEGNVWTHTQFPYSFWTRYLDVFDSVLVVARVKDGPSVPSDWKRADGQYVSFLAVPYYIGPQQFLMRMHQVDRVTRSSINTADAVILRAPGNLSGRMYPRLYQVGHPYGVEVVTDPYGNFTSGAIKHPLNRFFRWYFPRQLRHQCANACAASYVTQSALQHFYPPSEEAFSTHYSSIELPTSAFVTTPRPPNQNCGPLTLITVGSLTHLLKAPDILIRAFSICVLQKGLDLKLILIGDGKQRMGLEAQVASLGLSSRVCFQGNLPAGEAVRTQLDRADVFVLPSRQEGLPRAMIEAMARGLPCIGSTVGGIPELIPSEDLVPPNDAMALARTIWDVVTHPERMMRMSARNLKKAKEYEDELLRKRRISFYRSVRKETEAWIEMLNTKELVSF